MKRSIRKRRKRQLCKAAVLIKGISDRATPDSWIWRETLRQRLWQALLRHLYRLEEEAPDTVHTVSGAFYGFAEVKRNRRYIIWNLSENPLMLCVRGDFMSDKVEIGKTIVKLRKSRRITQEQLAEAANVSVSYLRDIEHDCANPTINILEDIADALGMPLFVLIMSSTAEEEREEALNKTVLH